MTTELAQGRSPANRRRKRRAPGELSILFTRLVLFWERFWPAVLPALAIPYVIVIISLFDLWRLIPVWLHWTTLTLAGLAFASMAWRDCRDIRIPSRREAQARLEEDGRTEHAPLQALDDAPFQTESVSPLWRAHMEASRERARKARFGGLRPTADDRDPYALRFTAIGLLAVAMVAAGSDWRERISLALAPGLAQDAGRLIADLWIEPPDYTGKAPIYLLRAGEDAAGLADQANAPQGSVLVAQINGRGRPRLDYATAGESSELAFNRTGGAMRAELSLQESGVLKLRLGAREAQWPIGVLADAPPKARFIEAPGATDDALLAFSVSIEDDYGVASAQMQFRLDPEQERPLDFPAFDEAALSQTRVATIESIAGVSGERAITMDLQEDPWAGLTVLAKIVVADGANQFGETEEVAVKLPERVFFNPLAKTVI